MVKKGERKKMSLKLKDRIIDPAGISREKAEYILRHLYCLPWSIRVTYETIPAIPVRDDDDMIYPYDPDMTIPEYLEVYGDNAPASPEQWRDNYRVITRIAGYNPHNLDRDQSLYSLSISQGTTPIGADIITHRLSPLFNSVIGPMAALLPDTYGRYGMMEDGGEIPCGIAGKGAPSLERIWYDLGGKVEYLFSDPDAIIHTELYLFSIEDTEEWKEVISDIFPKMKEKFGITDSAEELTAGAKKYFFEGTDEEKVEEDEKEEEWL